MMTDINGAHFNSLFPEYLLSEDHSSHNIFAGTVQDDHINNGWACVTI